MAEALVNVLLERLAMITIDKVGEEFNLVTGVEKEVKCLTHNLEAIRAVLEDAEQRQVAEAAVRHWLSELTEVSFDMDDVLDEWLTEVLKRQMERQEQQGENTLSTVATTKKKVCFPCLSSCFCFGQVNHLMLRRDIAVRIKELNERLALIDKAKQTFPFQNTTRVPEQPQRTQTSSLPNVKTFGRDNDKNLIVSKLLNESSDGNEVPLIIPIVGMGGMGKTALAQLVYNDENVKSHFDKRAWVCVSDPFEEIKIAQHIIEGLDKDNTSKNSNVLQILVQCIYELLEGKKFLLVLDDVWSPKPTQWEELFKPLCNGALGSRVLVTTRKEEVITLMKATTQRISLRELGESFCLSLFFYSAGMDEISVSKEFHTIGLEIVKRSNGIPLVAKTLGSLMRSKNKIHEWRAVLNNKIWELKEIQQDVFRPLLLSYQDLSPTTKRCFLYCVLFPKDYIYYMDNLIELWMSQDYLNVKGSKEMELIGQNCFDDLVMRSFFQDVNTDDNGNMRCKIHDIVHDFLQYLTKSEFLFLDLNLDAAERIMVSDDKVHHLTLSTASNSESLVQFPLNYKRLRTFQLRHSFSDSIGPISELIVQMKSLRTLALSPPVTEFKEIPGTIGGLIHLRYLDLSRNKFEDLPNVICSLYNLQTLNLVFCCGLKKVDVGRLINLRHLHVYGCSRLTIKGIEKLAQLQTLDEFYVGGSYNENKLDDLKDLYQFHDSLDILMKGNPNLQAENNAGIMVNKPHLKELKLNFPSADEGESREIMNALAPHPNLEFLFISEYRGVAFSHWFGSLHSLRVLTLEKCSLCETLPPLGRLASLESLTLRLLPSVSKVGVEFLGILEGETSSLSSNFISFPKLKKLTIECMGAWEEWEGVDEEENITIMPCLSHLSIYTCDHLKALPDFLRKTPLQKLRISESPILQNLYGEEKGEKWSKISHIPTIELADTPECCIS